MTAVVASGVAQAFVTRLGVKPVLTFGLLMTLGGLIWFTFISVDGSYVGDLLGGFLLMLWLPHVPVPAWAARAAGVLAGASLFIYLTHWQVYPHLEVDHPLLATLASFAVGIVVWRAYGVLVARARRLVRSARRAGRGTTRLAPLSSRHARLHGRRPDRGRTRLVPQARRG